MFVNLLERDEILQERFRQEECFGKVGDEACLVHFGTGLVEQGKEFRENALHAALSVHVVIVSLEGDAEHLAVDKCEPVRRIGKVRVRVINLEPRLVYAQAEIDIPVFHR